MLHPALMRMLIQRNRMQDQYPVTGPVENVGSPPPPPQRRPGMTPDWGAPPPQAPPQQAQPVVPHQMGQRPEKHFAVPHEPPSMTPDEPEKKQGYWDKLFADPTRMALLRYGMGVLGGEPAGTAMDRGLATSGYSPNKYEVVKDPYGFGGAAQRDQTGRFSNYQSAPTAATRRVFMGADGYKRYEDTGERVFGTVKRRPTKDSQVSRDIEDPPGSGKYYRVTGYPDEKAPNGFKITGRKPIYPNTVITTGQDAEGNLTVGAVDRSKIGKEGGAYTPIAGRKKGLTPKQVLDNKGRVTKIDSMNKLIADLRKEASTSAFRTGWTGALKRMQEYPGSLYGEQGPARQFEKNREILRTIVTPEIMNESKLSDTEREAVNRLMGGGFFETSADLLSALDVIERIMNQQKANLTQKTFPEAAKDKSGKTDYSNLWGG